MPNPDVVKLLPNAVFPTVRGSRENRMKLGTENGQPVMIDDNVTPRWALLWSHGISSAHHLSGWMFAHVWAYPKRVDAYTNLANLCMMPEYFGSLSDKKGPLCSYLRYHAWNCYHWHPESEPPSKPEGYDTLQWRYLNSFEKPRDFITERIASLDNQRVKVMRGLMEEAYSAGHSR
jgi:hypothetical protein